MPLQSTRFIKRCWCGQPASVCKKAAAEAQDKGVCPKCGARPHIGDYVHCPHDHDKMPKAFHDNLQAEIDAENAKDFQRMLARESKVKNQIAKQGLERFKFKSLLIQPLPGIWLEHDGSISGYAYNICISALAGYAIAKRDGTKITDFANVEQCENITGVIITDRAKKIQEIRNWLSKRLDHSGATMQAALNLLALLLKDGPKNVLNDHAKIAIEFDLETAIARLYYNYSGAMQEIIDTVLLLKDDRELCTIAE